MTSPNQTPDATICQGCNQPVPIGQHCPRCERPWPPLTPDASTTGLKKQVAGNAMMAGRLENERDALRAQLASARAELAEAKRELEILKLQRGTTNLMHQEELARTTRNAIETSKALRAQVEEARKDGEELHRILVMLKRELDKHPTDSTKYELPKEAWDEAVRRANAIKSPTP